MYPFRFEKQYPERETRRAFHPDPSRDTQPRPWRSRPANSEDLSIGGDNDDHTARRTLIFQRITKSPFSTLARTTNTQKKRQEESFIQIRDLPPKSEISHTLSAMAFPSHEQRRSLYQRRQRPRRGDANCYISRFLVMSKSYCGAFGSLGLLVDLSATSTT
jgi:hypothetical protein